MDLSNDVEIDYMPVGSAYYNSCDAINYNNLVTAENNSINSITSKIFTKEVLPSGLIIEIKQEYQYRPDGWIDETPNNNRPETVNTNFIIKET